jgi:hypothetical protein
MTKAHFILLVIFVGLLLLYSACRKSPPTGTAKQEITLIDTVLVFEGDGGITKQMNLIAGDTLDIEAALINCNIIRCMSVVDEEERVMCSAYLFTSGAFYVPIASSQKYSFTIGADDGIGPTKLYVKVMVWRWE